VYAVSQHIENAGVHSGDATLVLPPIYEDEAPSSTWKGKSVGLKGLSPQIVKDSKTIAEKVAKAFNITGPFNMQIILSRDETDPSAYTLKVIECNLRGILI
jgi:carbamoyl-phosphate synthase large subunit